MTSGREALYGIMGRYGDVLVAGEAAGDRGAELNSIEPAKNIIADVGMFQVSDTR